MELKINTAFRNMKQRKDSYHRVEHVFDRMKNRGIGLEQIKDAVRMGAKRIREDGSIVAEFRWFKVIYREFHLENIRKIYPITVIEAHI